MASGLEAGREVARNVATSEPNRARQTLEGLGAGRKRREEVPIPAVGQHALAQTRDQAAQHQRRLAAARRTDDGQDRILAQLGEPARDEARTTKEDALLSLLEGIQA